MLGPLCCLSHQVNRVSVKVSEVAPPRSVFMSLRDLPNEGRVLVGLAFGALELVTTGGITQ